MYENKETFRENLATASPQNKLSLSFSSSALAVNPRPSLPAPPPLLFFKICTHVHADLSASLKRKCVRSSAAPPPFISAQPIPFHFVAVSTLDHCYGLGWVPPKYCSEIPSPRAQSLTVFRDETCIDLCISEDISRRLLDMCLRKGNLEIAEQTARWLQGGKGDGGTSIH